jgi:ABC-type phosphate transport system substrate-binding protein
VVDDDLYRYLKTAGLWSIDLFKTSAGAVPQSSDLLGGGKVEWYLSKFRPPTLNSTVLVNSFAVGILPLCVVYHVNDVPTPQLGLDTASLGAALSGLLARVLTDDIFPTVYASGWDFTYHVPVAQSGLGDAFLQSMAASGVANFSATAYSPDVLVNPNVTMYASETEIADAVAAAPGRIGIVSLSTALRYRLPCMQLRIPRLKNTDLITTPRLLLASQSLYRVSGSVVVPNAANQLTYPLVGAVVLHTNPGLSCGNTSVSAAGTRIGERTLSFLFGLLNASFDRALQLNGALPVSSTTRNAVVSTVIRVLCTGREVIAAGGSTAVQLLLSEWIAQGWQQAGMYMSYAGTGSGAGVIGVRGGSLLVGGSEAPLNATDVELNPTLQLIPMIATPLSVIVNIGESGAVIRLPRCMLPPLMAGLIPFWDDASIQAVNPSLVLPRQAVTVLHRSDSSGSTEVFLTGLRALDMECTNGSLGIRVGTAWPFNNTNRQSASGTGALMTLSSRVNA